MKHFSLLVLLVTFVLGDLKEITLAKTYDEQNITGWYASEKLDGVRGIWSGKRFHFRSGKIIDVPENFLKNFPNFPLDGEFWIGRGEFDRVSSIVRSQKANWDGVTYNIFDIPIKDIRFQKRIEKAKKWFEKYPNPNVKIIEQTPLKNKKHLEELLKKVESYGGEGVMVRDPNSFFESGRSSTILKVKSFFDKEAKILEYKDRKGKFKGKVGSLKVIDEEGNIFFIGSGLSDELRENPPKIGEIITFKYYGRTKNNKYRFPSFLRVRNNYDWKE